MKTTAVLLGIAGLVFAGVIAFSAHFLGFFGRGTWTSSFGEQTKGHLGSIRSALSIYYGDTEGQFPADLAVIENRRWLEKLPPAQTRIHADSTKITPLDGQQYQARQFTDSGGWYYVTSGLNRGTVGVDCTHTDSKGSIWNAY